MCVSYREGGGTCAMVYMWRFREQIIEVGSFLLPCNFTPWAEF